MTEQVIYPALTALVTGFLTWFFSRRKQRADESAAELGNVKEAITIWRESGEAWGAKVMELTNRITSLQATVDTLVTENRQLKEHVATLEGTVETLVRENRQLKDELKKHMQQ